MPRTYTCDCLRLCGGALREVTRAQWRYHEQLRGPQTAARISVWQLRENAGVSGGAHTTGTSNEKDGDEDSELGNQADQDNDPYLPPDLIVGILDFLDGSDYLEAVVDGRIKPGDVVLMMSVDGAQLYESKMSDCWVGIWVVFDRSPEM
ncbi:hypothetical protein F4604DRAFT_1675126 [Suillus subluteus]|nr:hypothetical protein F4604DRAFT_1675126 [Suillus subluteus]